MTTGAELIRNSSWKRALDAKRELYSNFPILHEGITHDQYQKLLQRKSLPNPHFWVAHTGVIYSGLHPKLAGNPTPKPFSEAS